MLRSLVCLLTACFTSVGFSQQPPVLRALPLEAEAVPLESTLPSDARPAEGDDAVRVQIFLDEAMFGPGVIDGKPGRFTEQAARSWNERNGHPLDSWLALNTAARAAVPNPVALAVVPETVTEWVDTMLPTSRAGQAKRKRMSYRSVGEFMSERYHSSLDYLIQLNGAEVVRALKPRDTLLVPNVTPFRIEVDVTGAKHETAEVLGERYIVVDTKMNQVRIFEAAPKAVVIEVDENGNVIDTSTRPNEALVASFPITPGQERFIEYGTWQLRNMVELPWWRYDQQFLDTGRRSENALNIPPGPNSPIGVIWCGTSRSGIGLHGTDNPDTIGRARSAGCIRLANWDAIRLPRLIRPGATLVIR
jgi:lipoprotein-anchoring transpeptidase ErfK/SrfK